jgi:CheY-like chemotaxis protein
MFKNTKILKIISGLNTTKKILPEENIDKMSTDLTTYIRCLFHDLRGPLNNIFLGLEIVMNSMQQNSENYKTLDTVKESCNFLNDSLDGFLNIENNNGKYANIIEMNYAPFNIVGLIKKVQYILLFNALQKKIEIKYNVKKIKEWVIGDDKRIQHVIMNLLSNAIKFSAQNSIIQLDIECINIINKTQHILITISDDNTFIPNEIKKKLFEKYNTSDNNNGNGLGLYICRKIIELHKGTIKHHFKGDNEVIGSIKYENKNNKGNIFQIQLFLDICPTSERDLEFNISDKKMLNNDITNKAKVDMVQSVTNTDEKAKVDMLQSVTNTDEKAKVDMLQYVKNDSDSHLTNNSKIIFKGVRKDSIRSIFTNSSRFKDNNTLNIMVVDDSEISLKFMVKILEANCSNVNVFHAEDGLNALLKVIGFKDKIDKYVSMFFIDNIMPNITGELLSKILRGIGYSGLIIGVTGNGVEEDKTAFIESGADYVFVKPFKKEKLNKILEFVKNNGYESRYDDEEIIIEKENKLVWQKRG